MKNKKIRSLICIMLSILLIMSNIVYGDTVKGDEGKYPDIVGNKYEAQLRRWIDNGFIKGTPDGYFKPYDRVSRAEFMALVNRAFGFKDAAEANFSDVNSTDWFHEDVRKAVKNGYMIGSDGKMRPMSNISRQEFAIVLARLAKYDIKVDDSLLSGLMDKDSIPSWSKGAVGAAYSRGLFKDFVLGLFKPMENISRLEVVVVLDRLLVQMGLLIEEPMKIMPSMPGLSIFINGLSRIDNTHFSSTVTKGSSFKLPETASFRMPDGSSESRDITWAPKTVSTSTAGTYTITGTIPGYGTITLTLTVSVPSQSGDSGGGGGGGGDRDEEDDDDNPLPPVKEVTSGEVQYTDNQNGSGTFIVIVKDQYGNKMPGLTADDFVVSLRGQNYVVGQTTTMSFEALEDNTYQITFNAGIAINEVIDVAVKGVIIKEDMTVIISVPKAHIPMEIEYDVPEFTAGVPDTFKVRTIPNDDAGKMVRAYFTLPEGVVVEYREAEPAGTGIIEGTVNIWDGGNNEGITVTAKGYTENGSAIEISAVTNADGSFTIEGLPTGNFVVQAAKEGYFSSGRLVKATDGENVQLDSPIVLYLLENAGSIEGYARYLDRENHTGIAIRIQTPEGEELPDLIAMTDENGFFRFEAVPTLPEAEPMMVAAKLGAVGGTTYILTASALNDNLRLATDSISVVVYPNQTSVLPEDSNLWLRPAAQSAIIFADDETPWNSFALSEMLDELGVDYTIYRSSDMATTELPLDSIVWIINDQPQDFYNTYAANQQKFDDFVRDGGTLLFEACDEGWNEGSILGAGATLPGGVKNELHYSYTNTVINPTHPMMESVDTNLYGNYASHNYFIDFPDISTILCVDDYNNPTLVEYKYEHGRVIATGQTLEHGWKNDNNTKDIYPNMIYYTFNLPIPAQVEAEAIAPMKAIDEEVPSNSGNAEALERQQDAGVKPLMLEAAVELEVEDEGWIPLNGVFGPEEGFPLSDITTTFRATFETEGEYRVNVEFRAVENDEVLGSKEIVANVGAAPVPVVTSGEVGFTDNHDGSGTFIVTVKDQFGNKISGLTGDDFVVSLRGQSYVVGETPTLSFDALEDGTYKIVFDAGIAINEVVDVLVGEVIIADDMPVVISALIDQYEPDNTELEAKSIPVDGSIQKRTIYPALDEDWIRFEAVQGKSYRIRTLNLVSFNDISMDTVVELYDSSREPLASNDDAAEDLSSELEWTPEVSGTYYIRVLHYNDWDDSIWEDEISPPRVLSIAKSSKSKTDTIQALVEDESTGEYEIYVEEDDLPVVYFNVSGFEDETIPADDKEFSVNVRILDNGAIPNDMPLRYAIAVEKDDAPLSGLTIRYPEAGDDLSDMGTWHSFVTGEDGTALFGPSSGFTLEQLPGLLTEAGVTTMFMTHLYPGEYTVGIALFDWTEPVEDVLAANPISFVIFDFTAELTTSILRVKEELTDEDGAISKVTELKAKGFTFTEGENKLTVAGSINPVELETLKQKMYEIDNVFAGFTLVNPNPRVYTKLSYSDFFETDKLVTLDEEGNWSACYNLFYNSGDGWTKKQDIRTMTVTWGNEDGTRTLPQTLTFDATDVVIEPVPVEAPLSEGSKEAQADMAYDSDADAVGVAYKVLYDNAEGNLNFYVRAVGEPENEDAELAYLVINVADTNSTIGDTSTSFDRGAYIVPGIGEANAVAGGDFTTLNAADDGWYMLSLQSADYDEEVGVIVTAGTKIPARYVENTLYEGESLTWTYDNFIKFVNPNPGEFEEPKVFDTYEFGIDNLDIYTVSEYLGSAPADGTNPAMAFPGAIPALVSIETETNNLNPYRGMVRIEPGVIDEGIQLWAQDTVGRWYDIAQVGWGPLEGFQIAAGLQTPVYVAASPGSYSIAFNLVDITGDYGASGDIIAAHTMELGIAAYYNKYSLVANYRGIEAVEPFDEGVVPVDGDFAGAVCGYVYIEEVTSDGVPYTGNVRVVPSRVDPDIQLWGKDSSDNWWDIAKVGWGPTEGFPIDLEAETAIYVAAAPGTYNLTFDLIDIDGSYGAEDDIIDTLEITIIVQDPYDTYEFNVENFYNFDVAPYLEEAPASAVVFDGITPLNISINTILDNDNPYMGKVRIEPEFPYDGIQFWAQDSVGNWYDIGQVGWGPAEGFVIDTSAVTNVYVAAEPGSYQVGFNLVDIDGTYGDSGNILANFGTSITVSEPQ